MTATAGLGWYMIYMLRGIRFAVENGYIPVIDWQNCKIPQYDASKVGERNIWELFFEQPFNTGIKQAYESEDFFVIDDIRSFLERMRYPGINAEKLTDYYDRDMREWRQWFQRYIRIKKEVKEYFEQCRLGQFSEYDNVIGILVRGTDYKELKPAGHMKPIPAEEIFDLADEFIDHNEKGQIFLATEDQGILEEFQNRYVGKVIFVDAKRYGHLGHNTLNTTYKNEDGYERDLKYLYSLYIISRCGRSIYSACGGGIIASLMREEFGVEYHFLTHGLNKAKGIIVGSQLEKEQQRMITMGGKPIMYYALNTLKLLDVEEVDILISRQVEENYRELIGCGENYGMNICYVVSETYDVADYMAKYSGFMMASRVVLLYADYFAHGADIGKELLRRACEFDGACAWGIQADLAGEFGSVKLNKKTGMPEEILDCYQAGSYSFMGKYIFDYELRDIIKEIIERNGKITFTDILGAYIYRKKLFFYEYKRGTVYSCIKKASQFEKTGKLIELMEELQGQTIGDFEEFRKNS